MELRGSAFLFDLDGVLVDSRAVVERVCRTWARRHGLDPEMVLRTAHGRRTRDTVAAVAPHLDIPREVAWLDAAELADVDGLVEVPGVRRVLTSLAAGSWAVVTSCTPDLARLRLTSVSLPIPQVVVTSADVARGKPAPDAFQLGAKRLGYDAAACVAFEDAPPGVAAARAAGARVVALRTTHPEANFAAVEAVIPDFTGLRVRRDEHGYLLTIL
ncbi:MAG TPA: HAD-IA family hydrolase [Gemmatimonadales bacterium]|nr:HAD-IA family hydrolase [Gemmatimonadales bacterium]